MKKDANPMESGLKIVIVGVIVIALMPLLGIVAGSALAIITFLAGAVLIGGLIGVIIYGVGFTWEEARDWWPNDLNKKVKGKYNDLKDQYYKRKS